MSIAKAATEADKARIIEQFRLFDQDGNGGIDKDEMAMVLQVLEPDVWTDKQIKKLFKQADLNKDGKIQIEEFVSWAFAETPMSEELRTTMHELETPTTAWGKSFKRALERETAAK